jgi:hypothetical protein
VHLPAKNRPSGLGLKEGHSILRSIHSAKSECSGDELDSCRFRRQLSPRLFTSIEKGDILRRWRG